MMKRRSDKDLEKSEFRQPSTSKAKKGKQHQDYSDGISHRSRDDDESLTINSHQSDSGEEHSTSDCETSWDRPKWKCNRKT